MGTAVVLAALGTAVALVIAGRVRNWRSGKTTGCDGDCSHCHNRKTHKTT